MSSPKDLHVHIVDRDFEDIVNPVDLIYTVNRYSKTIYGGCKEAYITAFGTQNNLWKLANMLRYGIYIYNSLEEPVWWGYIAEVKIRTGNLVYGVSVDSMANRIAVVYTSFGVRNTTSWAEDDYSVDVYGTKELLSVVSDATTSEAGQRRDSDLNHKKLPIPTVDFEAQPEGSFSAQIVARGLYDTLGWKYYSQEKGLVSHSINGVGQQNVGVAIFSACLVFNSSNNEITHWGEELKGFNKGSKISISGTSNNNGTFTIAQGSTSGCSIKTDEGLVNETSATTTVRSASQIAQRFRQLSGSTWDASSIHVRIQKSGSPTDNFAVALYSWSGGCPNTLLTSGTVAGSNVQETMAWTEMPLSSCVTLGNGTYYWVSAFRTGCPLSGSEYYKVDMDEGLGYVDGEFLISESNGWLSRPVDADMLFKVVGTQSVAEQIKEIGNTSGQFLNTTFVDLPSACAVETNQYRDGETTALTEVNDLLKVGTLDNLQIIAEITRGRRLLIKEQDDRNNPDLIYKMGVNGRLYDYRGNEIPNSECKVGIWAEIDDFIPVTFDTSYLSNPGKFFVEECEYYVQSDIIVPRSKDTSSVWELGKIKEG